MRLASVSCSGALLVLPLILAASCSEGRDTPAKPAPSSQAASTTPPASCAADQSGFTAPEWKAPHAPRVACTLAEIDGYLESCLHAATAIPAACEQFNANHAACAECLLPEDDAGGSGPLVERPGAVDVDVAGCIAVVLDDARPEGCGAREATARACAAGACAKCDDPACPEAARQTVCADWQLRTCPELAGAAPCTITERFDDAYRFAARAFCATPEGER